MAIVLCTVGICSRSDSTRPPFILALVGCSLWFGIVQRRTLSVFTLHSTLPQATMFRARAAANVSRAARRAYSTPPGVTVTPIPKGSPGNEFIAQRQAVREHAKGG